jgi:hypothetical protein
MTRKATFLALAAVFLLTPSVIFAQTGGGIRWFYSLDSAQRRAQATGTNIVVLITAPSWCSPCRWMEENTLQDETVIQALNEQFTALLMLDTNPQHRQFAFPGYPTVIVTDPLGEVLETVVGAKTATELRGRLAVYADYRPGGDYNAPQVRYVSDDGFFQRVDDKRWQEQIGDIVQYYAEYDADSDYYYIRGETNDSFVAVPRDDGLVWYWSTDNDRWQALRPVRKTIMN